VASTSTTTGSRDCGRPTDYVDDIDDAQLAAALDAGFTPSTNPQTVAECDVYVMAVPTGMDGDEPDLTAVEAAARTVREQAGARETLVVVSSTVYPGATREVVEPIVTEDRDSDPPMHFAMVPERINPGGEYELADIPVVVGANTDAARAAAGTLFDSIVAGTHPVGTTETAELTKTLENTYRMVNIALVNELVTLAEGLEADVWDAIDAAQPSRSASSRSGPAPASAATVSPSIRSFSRGAPRISAPRSRSSTTPTGSTSGCRRWSPIASKRCFGPAVSTSRTRRSSPSGPRTSRTSAILESHRHFGWSRSFRARRR